MIKNKFVCHEGTAFIDIERKGYKYIMLMDEEDLEHFEGHNITIFMKSGKGYAFVNMTMPDGRKMEYIHRLVLTPPEGLVVDHKNGNKLDNRKANLRAVTSQENSMNKLIKPKNLYYNPVTNIYYPRVIKDGKSHYGKGSRDLEQAKRNAIEFREELFGEFA